MDESLQKSPEEGHEAQVMDSVTFRSDTVLSEVHLLLPNARHLMTRLNSVGQPVFLSKFRILSHEEKKREHSSPKQRSNSVLDEDGDLDVERRPVDTEHTHETIHPVILSQAERTISELEEDGLDAKDVIKIEHTMATPLEDVGKQIWRGALLLSDFILSNPTMFRDATVLELGSGTGLTSIALARMAKTVYCTDVGDDLLSMCKRNVQLNRCCNETSEQCGVRVRQLDWTADDFTTDSEFGWSEEEIADLYDNTTLIIAADVCYDDDLTDALIRTVYRIASHLRQPSTAYFCLEKRLNFTVRHMDVSCEAYDHFRHCLEQLKNLSDGKMTFTVSPVQCSFQQFFQYERVNQLELWKISASAL